MNLFFEQAVVLIEQSSATVSQLRATAFFAGESASCWHPADPSAPPSPCFEYVWATLRTNVFGNYSPLAFVAVRATALCAFSVLWTL